MRQQIYTLSDGRKVSAPATVRGIMQEIETNGQQINTLMHQGHPEDAEALSDRDCVLQDILLGFCDPQPEENDPEPTGDTALCSHHEYLLKPKTADQLPNGMCFRGKSPVISRPFLGIIFESVSEEKWVMHDLETGVPIVANGVEVIEEYGIGTFNVPVSSCD